MVRIMMSFGKFVITHIEMSEMSIGKFNHIVESTQNLRLPKNELTFGKFSI